MTTGFPGAGGGPFDPSGSATATDSPLPPPPRPLGWPHRSRADRKVAGVAGGLGRALGIDPLLLRVAFVVLTVFGGFGGLLYVIGWLLLPDDGEDHSAAQALLGRGRSSMPRPLAVALVVVAAVSVASMFSWGLPFWPVVVIGAIVLVSLGRHGRGPARNADWQARREAHWERHQTRWEVQAERQARRWADRAQRWEHKADAWGDKAERWINDQGWGGCGRRTPAGLASGPFARPAFWDRPDASTRVAGPSPEHPDPAVDLSKGGTRPDPAPADTPVDDLLTPRTPPAWDPLGVAPFAWDLPEPSPLATPVPTRPTRGGAVIARVTSVLALALGGTAAGLTLAGVWALSWAQVAALPLGLLGLGLLLSVLLRRGFALAAPVVLVGLLTLALGLTGLRGTSGYGNQSWQPTAATLQSGYALQTGAGTLDLTGVTVAKGQTVDTALTVRAGKATVLLPAGTTVDVSCAVEAGRAVCLDRTASGLHTQVDAQSAGSDPNAGTLHLSVTVAGGLAEVKRG